MWAPPHMFFFSCPQSQYITVRQRDGFENNNSLTSNIVAEDGVGVLVSIRAQFAAVHPAQLWIRD